MNIEVTIKFDNRDSVRESDLQLAVSLLAALGAKFPSEADKPTEATEADKTKPA
jgi:hypothetical protein